MGYFVYKTTNTINGKIYVGVHGGSVCDGYLGSGKIIKQAIRKYGAGAFVREILHEFERLSDALVAEAKIVTSEFISRSDVYNVALGGGMPPTLRGDEHPNYGVKRPDSSIRMRERNPMKNEETRKRSRGFAVYILPDGTTLKLNKNDPLITSSGALPINLGKLTVRDSNGKVFHVMRDDPRLISGEVVHVSKGLPRTNDTVERWRFAKYGVSTAEELSVIREQLKLERKKKQITVVSCPHCGKSGKKSGAMAQHHFDNCKKK